MRQNRTKRLFSEFTIGQIQMFIAICNNWHGPFFYKVEKWKVVE